MPSAHFILDLVAQNRHKNENAVYVPKNNSQGYLHCTPASFCPHHL